MDIAALITWVVTALGGFYLLGIWIAKGGVRQQRGGATRLPAPVVFGHLLLAAVGLVVWIAYLVADTASLAWTGFVLLVPVALLGFVMLARWIPGRRAGAAAEPGAPAGEGEVPAERHFPMPAVVAHGLLAVATVVLVLLAALGGS